MSEGRTFCLLMLSKADSNHHKQNQNLLCYHYTIGQSDAQGDKSGAKLVVFFPTTKLFPYFFSFF